MKYEHIFNPVTDGGKLMQLLRSYQHDLACGKTSKDPKQVVDLLLWFDDQNEKLNIPSKKATKWISSLWSQYCQKK